MTGFNNRKADRQSDDVAAQWKAAVRFRQDILAARQQVLKTLLETVYQHRLDIRTERTSRLALLLLDEMEARCDLKIQHYLRVLNPGGGREAGQVRRRLVRMHSRRSSLRSGTVTMIKAQTADPLWRRWFWCLHTVLRQLFSATVLNRRRGLLERTMDVAQAVEAMVFDTEEHGFVNLAMAREDVRELSGQRFDPQVVDALLQAWPEVLAFYQKMVALG